MDALSCEVETTPNFVISCKTCKHFVGVQPLAANPNGFQGARGLLRHEPLKRAPVALAPAV